MNKPASSFEYYNENVNAHTGTLHITNRNITVVSNLRLSVVVGALSGAVVFYRIGMPGLMATVLCSGAVVFALLAVGHSRMFVVKQRLQSLVDINKQGVDRCENRWGYFKETGSEFENNDHPFSSDLDIFGKHSLFQYCCTARSCFGKQQLADLLRNPPDVAEVILCRQEAVKELAGLADWRQGLESEGFLLPSGFAPGGLLSWAGDPGGMLIGSPLLRRIGIWLPALLCVAGIAGYAAGYSILFAIPFAGIHLLLSSMLFGAIGKRLNLFDKYSRHFAVYGTMLEHIGRQAFASRILQQLQKNVAMKNRSGAPVALRKLGKILSASEVRLSPLPWLLANTLMLWDLRCLIRLEQWKEKHGCQIREWLETIGAFEALCSLALLHFDYPQWCFPEFDETDMRIDTEDIAHPLLPREQRVANTVTLGPPGGSAMIITGSNMSGKSTLLRAIGVNLVLAYAGAPVCAKVLTTARMRVFTSMRTGDDLMSHTSTFYAELLRVKKIVDALGKKEPMLYLLDELFRGTNSADRHDGAVALLNELSRPHTLGMVSTHDLELCELAEVNTHFNNAHFEEQYTEKEITFDYTLRTGPSTTRNALYLMKMVGITGIDAGRPV